MPQDIGGGSKGQGGALADSTDPTVTNPATNRQQFDYTPPLDRGQAAELIEIPAAEAEALAGAKQFQIVVEGDDAVTGAPFENDTAETPTIQIAKPPSMRKTDFDGKTIDNELFTYDVGSVNKRQVKNIITGDIRFEEIDPSYAINDLLYAAESSNGTEVSNVDFIDLNVESRQMKEISPQRFQLQEVKDETLRCRRIFENDTIDTVDVEVARVQEFRKSTFDGQTVDDVSYVYSTPEARVATDTTGAEDIVENQLIIPPYRVGTFKDQIWAERVPDTGITSSKWLEKNNAGRQWQMDALDTPAP